MRQRCRRCAGCVLARVLLYCFTGLPTENIPRAVPCLSYRPLPSGGKRDGSSQSRATGAALQCRIAAAVTTHARQPRLLPPNGRPPHPIPPLNQHYRSASPLSREAGPALAFLTVEVLDDAHMARALQLPYSCRCIGAQLLLPFAAARPSPRRITLLSEVMTSALSCSTCTVVEVSTLHMRRRAASPPPCTIPRRTLNMDCKP